MDATAGWGRGRRMNEGGLMPLAAASGGWLCGLWHRFARRLAGGRLRRSPGGLLGGLPGVDMNDPEIVAMLAQLQAQQPGDESSKKKKEEEKK